MPRMGGNNKLGTPRPPAAMAEMSKIYAAKQKARTQEKANLFFIIYQELGQERSIQLLQKTLLANGLKTNTTTLQTYSSKFGWQKKLLEHATIKAQFLEEKTQAIVTEMNERHAKIAQVGMSIVIAGIRNLQEKITANQGKLILEPGDISTLYKVFQVGERLARGQATSKQEIQIEVTNTLVQQFALVFMEVNKLPEVGLRESEYARRCDEILTKYHKALPPPGEE